MKHRQDKHYPAILGANVPCWLCITAPHYAVASVAIPKGENPEHKAARLAKVAIAHEAALAREEERRKAKAIKSAESKAYNQRLREERSRQRQQELVAAKRAARKTPEQIAEIRKMVGEKNRAIWAVKKAAKEALREAAKPRSWKPPEGYISAAQAARELEYSATCISTGIKAGLIPCMRRGVYTYVTLDAVKAYRDRMRDYKTESIAKVRGKGVAAARAARIEKYGQPSRPWPRLLKRYDKPIEV